MNYLEPYHVADAVKQIIKDNIDSLQYSDTKKIKTANVDLIYEDPTEDIENKTEQTSEGLVPPWAGIFFNLIDTGEVLEDGSTTDVPVLIGILVSSSKDCKTGNEALREAMFYSRMIIDIVIKTGLDDRTYSINVAPEGEPEDLRLVSLRCDPLPRQIINVSANLTTVMARFRYYEN